LNIGFDKMEVVNGKLNTSLLCPRI